MPRSSPATTPPPTVAAVGRQGRSPNPATHRMLGRAEGIAAGPGVARPAAEHVLVAILWDPETTTASHLDGLGVTRGRVLDRLRDAGAVLPPADPPAAERRRWGERLGVPIEQLPALRAELRDLL